MVADGFRQEIGCLFLVCQLNDLLRAAQVGVGLTFHQFSLSNEMARQVACDLEYCNGTFFHVSIDGDANA